MLETFPKNNYLKNMTCQLFFKKKLYNFKLYVCNKNLSLL